MYALLEKWIDAFRTWPPVNQMVFSAVLLLAGLVLVTIVVYVLYLMMYYLTVVCRGWPDDTERPTWKDIAYLSKTMEAYRQWEKQQLAAKQRSSTKPSSPSSKETPDAPQATSPVATSGP